MAGSDSDSPGSMANKICHLVVEMQLAHELKMANEVQARQAAEAQVAILRAALNAAEEDNGAFLQQLNELQTLFAEHGHNIPLYNMPAGYQDPRGRSLGGGYTQDASGVVRLRREQC